MEVIGLGPAEITEFLFPRQLVRYAGASGRVGAILSLRGISSGPVLMVADQLVHESGMTTALIDGLAAAGLTSDLFAGIVGEPELATVQNAVASTRVRPVAVVGIGGGSALDVARLVAYQMASHESLSDLRGQVPFVPNMPVLVMIPTTTGTGAEATRVAMLTVAGSKRAVLSSQFVPDVAILDNELVAALPPRVLAATALDALCHALESMMSSTSNDLTWQFSAEAARRIFAELPAAFEGDPHARSELLFASFLAGVSLNAGVTLGHSMSYVLARRHHLAHGVGCALALPYALAYNQTMADTVSREMAELVLARPGATLRDLVESVQQLTAAVGLLTDMSSLDAGDESPTLGTAVAVEYPRPTNPVPLDPERLSVLFTYLRIGDLSGAWTAMGVPQ
jgi:alcohol dehydrogenase class IV